MKLAICGLTYHRPEGLTRLLHGLRDLTFDGAAPDLRIIIVDNDPAGNAREVCDRVCGVLRWPLQYVVEQRRGIAFARNAALEAVGDADWIAFIDDDEVPSPDWIDELCRVQRLHNADVVGGPVVPYFPAPAPQWLLDGAFMRGERYATGQQLDHAYTNNVMFRAAIVRETNLRFDRRWALMGCEDLHFFQAVALAGFKIVWADDAIVTEWIPRSRTTLAWLLQRAFRCGNSDSCVEREIYPRDNPRGHPLIRALKRVIVGVWGLPLSLPFGRHRIAFYLRHIFYGAGMFAGWFGVRYEEYRTTHGK